MNARLANAFGGPFTRERSLKGNFLAMGINASGSVMSYFGDSLFFEFLRSLSPGAGCHLLELKH